MQTEQDRMPGDARNPAALSPLIAALFDHEVAAAELRDGDASSLLFPAEAAACEGFAPKRRVEYAAGRLCARRALAQFGITDFALEMNADRSPRWPDPVVGSITHTQGFCAAVVADARSQSGIGVDAETLGRLTPELHRLIFTAEERASLEALDASQRVHAQTIIFSAKEALYKCQHQVTRAWRDFHDVSIELPVDVGQLGDFVVHPSRTTSITDWGVTLPLRGRFVVDDGRVVTGISARRLDDTRDIRKRADLG